MKGVLDPETASAWVALDGSEVWAEGGWQLLPAGSLQSTFELSHSWDYFSFIEKRW